MLRNVIKYISILVVALAGSAGAKAGVTAETEIAAADSAYAKGEYAKAIALYENAVKEHGTSAELLCNLGNACVKAGDYGKAMLSYQRALRIDPSDSEVRNNMEFVAWRVQENNKSEIRGKKLSVMPDEPSFFENIMNLIGRRVSSNAWAITGAVCFLLFIVCAGLYVFMKDVVVRKVGFFGGGILIGLTVIFVAFAFYAARSARSDSEGVITAYKTTLYKEASATSKTNPSQLTRGTVMDVLDEEKGSNGKTSWYKVRLNSDFVGWVKSSDFELIAE